MDDKLNHLLMNAPERSLILLEDIDAAFNKRVQSSEDGYDRSMLMGQVTGSILTSFQIPILRDILWTSQRSRRRRFR
jgi:hypothetical protein